MDLNKKTGEITSFCLNTCMYFRASAALKLMCKLEIYIMLVEVTNLCIRGLCTLLMLKLGL